MAEHSLTSGRAGAPPFWLIPPLMTLAIILTLLLVLPPGAAKRVHAEPVTLAGVFNFYGGVYQGFGGSAEVPLSGVKVDLWGDMDDEPDGGAFARVHLATTTTEEDGKFYMTTGGETPDYIWFYVVKSDFPGTYDTAKVTSPPAEPVPGKPLSWVGYHNISTGEYGATRWWVWWDGVPTPTEPPPGPTKTPPYTATPTETSTATTTHTSTATPSSTLEPTCTLTSTGTSTTLPASTGTTTSSPTGVPAGTSTGTPTRMTYCPLLPVIFK